VITTQASPPSLYALRLQAGYTTQTALAARLGVSKATYGRIERGVSDPTPLVARKLARLLRMRLAALQAVLGRKET
jgi:DNA-binding XRE family transcriptional regulator